MALTETKYYYDISSNLNYVFKSPYADQDEFKSIQKNIDCTNKTKEDCATLLNQYIDPPISPSVLNHADLKQINCKDADYSQACKSIIRGAIQNLADSAEEASEEKRRISLALQSRKWDLIAGISVLLLFSFYLYRIGGRSP